MRTWEAGIRRGLAVTAVVASAVGGQSAAARGTAQGTETSGGAQAAQGRAVQHAVTLITGDRVLVTTRPDGTSSASLTGGPGRQGVGFVQQTIPGPGKTKDLLVIPSDAMGLLATGELDRQLFDVSELIRDHYDDASRTSLPLIVQYQGSGARPNALTQHGAAQTRTLPSINGAALAESKSAARSFWSTLTAAPAPSGTASPKSLSGAVAHVWLDGQMKAADDVSGPRVGAPAAYQAGYTGSGVLVADLDTGYDHNHPDLAGVVAQAQDFTGSASGTQDLHGHGTHTASIIAGSGAASAGKYHGVAYGAQLLVGKVLGDSGSGSYSNLIAGMQWAVAQHAAVINMSLGGLQPCADGTDPVSQALDSLSASSGSLFVVAAGNSGGYGPGFIDTPGVADAALTVGAVDWADRLAYFSSYGPRCGDNAVKPDITAPGVSIAAARAAGTSIGAGDGIAADGPIDANYTRASGTSMATPHATAAAAILSQQHPDWKAAQLKAALMDSAKPTAATSVFKQGDGRLDIARAITQNVTASTGSISEFLKWPHPAPVTRTVAYTNAGTTPQTLDLSLSMAAQDGTTVPTGLFGIAASQVTVPPGGTAQVPFTVDGTLSVSGVFEGRLTATSPDGTTVLQTAVGVYDEPERYTLALTLIDRTGAPSLGSYAAAMNLETGQWLDLGYSQATGQWGSRVPKGAYELLGAVTTAATATQPQSTTLIDEPRVQVDHDTTATLDARRGVPVKVTTDRPAGNTLISATVAELVAGQPVTFTTSDAAVYAVPTPLVTDRPYRFFLSAQLDNSTSRANQYATLTYSLNFAYGNAVPGSLTRRVHDSDLAVLRERFRAEGTPIALADDLHFPSQPLDADLQFYGTGSEFYIDPSALATDYFTPGSWVSVPTLLAGPDSTYGGEQEEGPSVDYRAGGSYHAVWGSAALGPASLTSRVGDVIYPDVLPASTSAPQSLSFDFNNPDNGVAGSITLSQGSTVLATGDISAQPPFDVPAADSAYTLAASYTRNAAWTALGTKIDASWTFRSGHVDDPLGAMLPLWSIRIGGDFNSKDQAPAGKPFRLTVAPDQFEAANPARVTSLHVAASFDDGVTWQDLRLDRNGDGQWTTTVKAPATASFVSLKAELTDAAGNTARQTVIRAYGLYRN